MISKFSHRQSAISLPLDGLGGKWDDRGGVLVPPFRCRWFFSWSELAGGQIAGYFAGYEGGGAFVEDRFYATFRGRELVEFIWNGRDHVSGEDRSSDGIPEDVARCIEWHFEIFMRWHDRGRWESGFLCLAPGLERGLVLLPDSLLLEPSVAAMGKIAAMARCAGILSSF